jgi:CBS domain-containing protein/beta-phosphoglucomutase-like phosphatase (HAD superfamily)
VALRAIIIRADGALADTGEAVRGVLNHVVPEAGFAWHCNRAQFEALGFRVLERANVARLVRKLLESQRQPDDIETLIDVMHRRIKSLVAERLSAGEVELRPGIRDLVSAAHTQGVRIGVVSTLKSSQVTGLLQSLCGEQTTAMIHAVACAEPGVSPAPVAVAYGSVLSELNVSASEALAIEATGLGLASAGAAGLKTLVTCGSALLGDNLDAAAFVADDVLTLISGSDRKPVPPLSNDQRVALLNALERLHAGQLDFSSDVERSAIMKVSDILDTKGSSVKTIRSDATIVELAQRLRAENVGVMVVMGANGVLDGIISERDLAFGLAEHGATVAGLTVGQLMTRAVITCSPGDTVSSISRVMTQRRIRHLPVVDAGALIGLVSIGDALKYRIEEIQLETSLLRDYAIARR